MTEIILVRHGETEWNVAEVFRGRIDVELSETGLEQAGLLAEYLSNWEIDAVYSSPLKRAMKTAEVIAQYHQLDVQIAPGLIDFNYGEWQGLSHQEVRDKHKELYAAWIKHPQRVKMVDGENLDEVRKRAMEMLEGVIAKYEGSIVLVSHRVVNKVLICALLGMDNSHFWNIRQDTCGITNFTCKNKRLVLTRHNDTSYLGVLKSTLGDF